jgi:hypothetical protein
VALSFVNAAGPFIIKPEDFQQNPEFRRLTQASPTVQTADGLLDADADVIRNQFLQGTIQPVAGRPDQFTLPMVPFGTGPIDVTPRNTV